MSEWNCEFCVFLLWTPLPLTPLLPRKRTWKWLLEIFLSVELKVREKLRISEHSCTFPINKSWLRAQSALHTATALHFLSLPEVKPSIACFDDSFPKLQLNYHNGRSPLIFTHVFSPSLRSFIVFQLKCDSLWCNFVRVHQPWSSSSPNLGPNTSVTNFILSLSIWCCICNSKNWVQKGSVVPDAAQT